MWIPAKLNSSPVWGMCAVAGGGGGVRGGRDFLFVVASDNVLQCYGDHLLQMLGWRSCCLWHSRGWMHAYTASVMFCLLQFHQDCQFIFNSKQTGRVPICVNPHQRRYYLPFSSLLIGYVLKSVRHLRLHFCDCKCCLILFISLD